MPQARVRGQERYRSKQRLASLKPANEDGVKTIILAVPPEMLTQPACPLQRQTAYDVRPQRARHAV